jgi:hypothetical protein
MKSTLSKEIEIALNAILTSSKVPSISVNVCQEAELEDFFRLEREGVCRYFLKN